MLTALKKVSSEITRPNDTTAYSANDMISSIASALGVGFQWSDVNPVADRACVISCAELFFSDTAVISGMGGFRVYLYDVAANGLYTDNAAQNELYATQVLACGYIDFSTPEDIGSCLVARVDGLDLPLQDGSTATVPLQHLYGKLVTKAGYTPAASTKVTCRLHLAYL